MHQKITCKQIVHIIFYWLLGLLIGELFAFYAADTLMQLIHSAKSARFSFTGLVIVYLFPLFLLAIGIKVHSSIIVFSVFFFKAFIHGYCILFYSVSYRFAETLFSLLFAENCSSVILFLFYFSVSTKSDQFKNHCVIFFSATATLLCFYYLLSNTI